MPARLHLELPPCCLPALTPAAWPLLLTLPARPLGWRRRDILNTYGHQHLLTLASLAKAGALGVM